MVLKFHMQHDEGFRVIKFSQDENQKWPLLIEMAKPIKPTVSPEPLGSYYTAHYEHYTCCSLVDSCLLLFYMFLLLLKTLKTGKFILHPKAAAYPVIKLV